MKSVHGFDFFDLHFDASGQAEQPQELTALKQHVTTAKVTDVVLIAHGFRNDEADADGLYGRFLQTLRAHFSRPEFNPLGHKKFAVAGVFWPSKTFPEGDSNDGGGVQSLGDPSSGRAEAEAELRQMIRDEVRPQQKAALQKALNLLNNVATDVDAQDQFAKLVLSTVTEEKPDPTEGLENIRAKDGSELLRILRSPVILPTSRDSDNDGGATAAPVIVVRDEDGTTQAGGSLFGSIFGGVGRLLNLTTWFTMKERSGLVGATGVADAVREIKGLNSAPKVHLVGHSLGGRLMTACAKTLAQQPGLHADSLTLLEAAYSHYGLSAKGSDSPEGFFRSVITSGVITGPFLATFSAKDTVVGTAYAISSRLAGDNSKAIGDKNDQFGGIGRNGAQKCDKATEEKLHLAGSPYTIATGKVMCLDGSDNLINNHGDITNEHVTYAFASALVHA